MAYAWLARGRPALHGLLRRQEIIQRDDQDFYQGRRRGAVDQVRQRDALRSVQDHPLAVTGTQEWPISRPNPRLLPQPRSAGCFMSPEACAVLATVLLSSSCRPT